MKATFLFSRKVSHTTTYEVKLQYGDKVVTKIVTVDSIDGIVNIESPINEVHISNSLGNDGRSAVSEAIYENVDLL